MVLGPDFGPAFDAVPGLKELMPESYGGDNKCSFEDICGNVCFLGTRIINNLWFFCKTIVELFTLIHGVFLSISFNNVIFELKFSRRSQTLV